MFEDGFLHLIHGKTIIWPVDRDTREPRHGLSKAAPSRNGNHPNQVPFYGFTGSVSPAVRALSQRLMVFSSDSGRRQECFLVCCLLDSFVLSINGVGQFRDHREHRLDEEVWARVTRVLLLRL